MTPTHIPTHTSTDTLIPVHKIENNVVTDITIRAIGTTPERGLNFWACVRAQRSYGVGCYVTG